MTNSPSLDIEADESADFPAALPRLTRDLRRAGALLDRAQARYLVDSYYQFQDFRIQSKAQVDALANAAEPNSLIEWQFRQMQMIENTIKTQLGHWAQSERAGRWAMSITGIGPVLAAGLLANIDIHKAITSGHLQRFVGYDPKVIWPTVAQCETWISQNGVDIEAAARHFGRNVTTLRRFATTNKAGDYSEPTAASLTAALRRHPWSARMKTLCWKIGESFMKVSNNPNDFYGKIYQERRALETERNEAGTFADQAAIALTTKRWGKDNITRRAYEQGKLPDSRILARSKRYATKLFISHLWEVMYECEYNTPAPEPYIIAHPEADPRGVPHSRRIAVPNWPCD